MISGPTASCRSRWTSRSSRTSPARSDSTGWFSTRPPRPPRAVAAPRSERRLVGAGLTSALGREGEVALQQGFDAGAADQLDQDLVHAIQAKHGIDVVEYQRVERHR